MLDLPVQVLNIIANLAVFIFFAFYLLKIRGKEKELTKKENELEKREGKIDTSYHQVVDDALTKERKILDDATREADQIITGAHYIKYISKDTVHQALQKMTDDIKKEVADTAYYFKNSYSSSLKQLADSSLKDIQNVAKELEADLQKQIKEFSDNMLPNLEKQVEEYKQARIKQAEQTIINIIQESSQEILNKSMAPDDHQKLVIESLEKAKKKGLFD